MDANHIDHVNIRIPKSGIDDAVAFYADGLGFEPEQLEAYRSGDRTLFSFRLGTESVLHVRPVDEFEPPSGASYDHWAIVVNQPIGEIKRRLEDAGINVQREGNPLGATGRAPAVYVEDPFGYIIELKERGDHS